MTDPKPVRPDRAEEEMEDRPEVAVETLKDLALSPESSEDVRAGQDDFRSGGCLWP